ncbi:MAG: response regulator transcription factor, partial [Myxococcales bacterium FL481]
MSPRKLQALVADDEALSRVRLERLLGAHPSIEVVAMASDGVEALQLLRSRPMDVAFLDLHMPGCDGLRLAGEAVVGESAGAPAIVFVTAFAEYAPQAFDLDAVDYLLKPICADRVARCVERIVRRGRLGPGCAPPKAQLSARPSALRRLECGSRVVIRQRERIDIVNIAAIERCVAQANYVDIVTPDGTYCVRETLTTIERVLGPAGFVRVHRSVLVQLAAIQSLMPVGNGEYRLRLTSGAAVESSRSARAGLLRALG